MRCSCGRSSYTSRPSPGRVDDVDQPARPADHAASGPTPAAGRSWCRPVADREHALARRSRTATARPPSTAARGLRAGAGRSRARHDAPGRPLGQRRASGRARPGGGSVVRRAAAGEGGADDQGDGWLQGMRRRVARSGGRGAKRLMNDALALAPWITVAAARGRDRRRAASGTRRSASPTRRSSRALDPHVDPLAVVSRPVLRRRRGRGAAAADRRGAFAAWAFAITLVLRLALAAAAARRRRHHGVVGGLRPGALATRRRTSTCRRSARCTGARASSSTASPRPCPALPGARAGHPPGLLLTLRRARDHLAGRDGGAVHRRRRAQRAARRTCSAARCSTSGARRIAALLLAFAPGALLFGATSADAVYLDARPARRVAAGGPLVARAGGRRRRARRRVVLRVVAARGRRLGGDRRAAARGLARRARAVGAVRRRAARVLRRCSTPAPASTRSARCARPRTSTAPASPRCARTGTGCSGSPTAFLLVLGLPITWYALRRSPRHTLAIAIFAVHRVRGGDGLHEGRDRADLAVLRAVRLPRRRHAATCRLRPVLLLLAVQALAWELVFDTVW